MKLINKIQNLFEDIEFGVNCCGIKGKSIVEFQSSYRKGEEYFYGTLMIYRIENISVNITGGKIKLNGQLSNETAVIAHLENLINNLQILEECQE